VSGSNSIRPIHEEIYPEAALNDAMEYAFFFLNDSNYDPLIRMTRFISSSMLHEESILLLIGCVVTFVWGKGLSLGAGQLVFFYEGFS